MDIIAVLRLILISPVVAFIVTVGLFYFLRHRFKLKASFSDCMIVCVRWASFAISGSLVIFILWMVWLSLTTKPALGQAPLAWIFGIGPISFVIGFIIGFIAWCKSSLSKRNS